MKAPRPANFDRVARLYRWAEYFALGPLLQRTRSHFLPQLRGARHAFLLGDGDGRFLARLLRQNPELHATAVDSSASMLRLLQARCLREDANADHRLTLQHRPAEAASFPPLTDLIVTHFFLDCLTQAEVDSLVARLAGQSAPGTRWLVSDFGQPQRRWLRPFAAIYLRVLYTAFRVLTGLQVRQLPDAQKSLQHHGFRRVARREFAGGFLYTEMWQRAARTTLLPRETST